MENGGEELGEIASFENYTMDQILLLGSSI
jgi:hypothetical protein